MISLVVLYVHIVFSCN